MLLYNTDDSLFTPTGLEDTAIPFVLIGKSAGMALKPSFASFLLGSLFNVTLDPTLHEVTVPTDIVAPFSSRGPAIGNFANPPALSIKPELVAPGSGIYTASQRLDPNGDLYDASGYTSVDGNSFSAALVAGAVALVKQAHPNYTPAQLKSAVVNSASTNVQDESGMARINSVGAGKLNAQAAIAAQVTVTPPTIGFGNISATLPSTSLTISNSGSAAVTLNFAVAQRDPDSRASFSVPSSLTLAAGQSSSITVLMAGSRPAAGGYDGQINITGSGVNLHVPYIYFAGTGVPANIFPIFGDGYTGLQGETYDLIAFRIVDQNGVPDPR